MKTYSSDWWYRHSTDTDQTVQPYCQMTMGIDTTDNLRDELASLQAQGYIVQRITIRPYCSRCSGNGQILVRRYKRKPAKYAMCATCAGDGCVGGVVEWLTNERKDGTL